MSYPCPTDWPAHVAELMERKPALADTETPAAVIYRAATESA